MRAMRSSPFNSKFPGLWSVYSLQSHTSQSACRQYATTHSVSQTQTSAPSGTRAGASQAPSPGQLAVQTGQAETKFPSTRSTSSARDMFSAKGMAPEVQGPRGKRGFVFLFCFLFFSITTPPPRLPYDTPSLRAQRNSASCGESGLLSDTCRPAQRTHRSASYPPGASGTLAYAIPPVNPQAFHTSRSGGVTPGRLHSQQRTLALHPNE
jgi:hypothetical protein